jgi:DNA-binding transcriptional MerR regulator
MPVSELARLTGLSPAAINYYVREGLLPPPVKTSATRANYDESYVERIARIKDLKSRGLTLKVIREVLNNPDAISELGIGTAIEGQDGRAAPKAPSAPRFQGPVDAAGFLEATGLTPQQANRAVDLGLLFPAAGNEASPIFDARDIAAGRAVARLLNAGIDFDLLARHTIEYDPITRAEAQYLAEHVAVVRQTDATRRATLETSVAFARIRDYLRVKELAAEYPEWLSP